MIFQVDKKSSGMDVSNDPLGGYIIKDSDKIDLSRPTNINVFISDQLDDLCASNMNTHHYKILKRTMKSIGRGSNHILLNSYMGSKQGFGIMIMTNIEKT